MKLDHFVFNVDRQYQENNVLIEEFISSGFPYEPQKGKGTKGFKASNLWIGNEYFEFIHILQPNGGGWKEEWVNQFNTGKRGMVCLMLDVKDIQSTYEDIIKADISLSTPEPLTFKLFFNLLTMKMPWKNSYFDFFEGIPLQIGLQQMDSEKAYQRLEKRMIPNSRDNQIMGISEIHIKGNFSLNDFQMIEKIFKCKQENAGEITIVLSSNQKIIFEKADEYSVVMKATSNNQKFLGKEIQIENCKIIVS